jgi:hypothetical protein
MRILLKSAAIALALAGTMLATTGASCADGFAISTSNHGRDHARTGVTFSFGDVAYGYQDGYWDNNRRWHKWRNRHEHDSYRDQYRDNYRDGRHDRYRSHGWRRDE